MHEGSLGYCLAHILLENPSQRTGEGEHTEAVLAGVCTVGYHSKLAHLCNMGTAAIEVKETPICPSSFHPTLLSSRTLSNTVPAYLESMQQIVLSVEQIDGPSDVESFVEAHTGLMTLPQPPPLERHQCRVHICVSAAFLIESLSVKSRFHLWGPPPLSHLHCHIPLLTPSLH